MADSDVFRIEIPVSVEDQTARGTASATQNLSRFEQSVQKSQQRLEKMQATKWQMTVHAVDRASSVAGQIESKLGNLTRKAWHIGLSIASAPFKAIGGLVHTLTSIPAILTGIASSEAIHTGILAPMDFAGQMEQAQLAFATMMHSAEQAKSFISDLLSFSNKTPFQFPDLQHDAQILEAMTFNVKEIIPDLKIMGDAASGLGKGSEGLDEIAQAFGKMKAMGKVNAREMMQLSYLGINGWQMLADGMGKSVEQVQKLSEQGKLHADTAIPTLLQGMEKQFPNMMQVQSRTLLGLLSTIKDNLRNTFVLPWGQGWSDAIKPKMEALVNSFDTNGDKMKKWGEAIHDLGQRAGEAAMGGITWLQNRIEGMVNSPAWQSATTLGGKLKVAWDQIITQPFDEWWNSGGKLWVHKTASAIGGATGSAIGGFIRSALGIASADTETSPFLDAGATAGRAFFSSFWRQLDFKEIVSAAIKAFDNVQGTWLGTFLDLWLASKAAGAAKSGLDMTKTILDLFGGRGGAGGGPGIPGMGGCGCGCGPGSNPVTQPPTKTIFGPNGEPLSTVPVGGAGAGTATAAEAAGGMGLGTAGLMAGGVAFGTVAALALAEHYRQKRAQEWNQAWKDYHNGNLVAPDPKTAAFSQGHVSWWSSFKDWLGDPLHANPTLSDANAAVNKAFPDGASAAKSAVAADQGAVSIHVSVSAPVTIQAAASGDDVLQVLNDHGDWIAGTLARKLEETFANKPTVQYQFGR